MNDVTMMHPPRTTPPEDAGEPVAFTATDQVTLLAAPGSPRAESVGSLRAHIMSQHLAAGHRSLAICSPTPGIGCTTLAVNLAVALADVGVKTLLIDTDMRRPSLERFVTPSREVPGLAQCLGAPGVPFGDAICHDALPNLSLIYAGGPAERPQDLLAAPRFQQLAGLCAREFDLVIADTPPANASADARRVAAVMGYALLVAGCDKTFLSDIKLLTEELVADRSSVIGAVLSQK